MAGITDRVVIKLGDDTVRTCKSYHVEMGVMTQPSRFAVTLGHNGTIKTLLDRYPKGTKFELYVQPSGGEAPRLQFGGFTDGAGASGQSATVTFRGRDALAKLNDTKAKADKSYVGFTYERLVTAILKDAGYQDAVLLDQTIDDTKSKTGASVVKGSQSIRETGFKSRTRKVVVHPVQIRAGQPYYQFLRTYLDRAGMFLFATAGGQFVLMEPDPSLLALYSAVNRKSPANAGLSEDRHAVGNVEDFEFDDDATGRMSECVVFGSGGGLAFGRTRADGRFFDDELQSLGIIKAGCFVDANVSSDDEAAFFAKRKIAESRREGWTLRYTFAGHTTPALRGHGRLVWARNTMVDVDDQELGLSGSHYIEHLSLDGDEERTWTHVRLMRTTDLVFGE